jgi:hypothetical protein
MLEMGGAQTDGPRRVRKPADMVHASSSLNRSSAASGLIPKFRRRIGTCGAARGLNRPAGIDGRFASLRRRVEQTTSLDERLADHLRQIEERVKNLPPGPERIEALKKAEKLRHGVAVYNYFLRNELKPPG